MSTTLRPMRAILTPKGYLYSYRASEAELLAAGVVRLDEMPSGTEPSGYDDPTGDMLACRRKGTELRVAVDASLAMRRDLAFSKFYGALLAEAHLALGALRRHG